MAREQIDQSKRKKGGPTRKPNDLPDMKPKLKFRELVHFLQKDAYFARLIHEVVKYGRKGQTEETWALGQLHHIMLPLEQNEWDELGLTGPPECVARKRRESQTR